MLNGHPCLTCSCMCGWAPCLGCCCSNQGVCAQLWWGLCCPCRIPLAIVGASIGCCLDIICGVYYCCYGQSCNYLRKQCFDCDPWEPVVSRTSGFMIVKPWYASSNPEDWIPIETVSKCAYYVCCVYYNTTPFSRVRVELCRCCKEEVNKKEVAGASVAPIDISKPADYPADR